MTMLIPSQVYKIPKIAIFIETSSMYGRQLLKGIGRYIRQHEPWEVFMEPQAVYEHIPQWLDNWQGDGIISRLNSSAFIVRIRQLQIPGIDLNDWKESHGFPLVRCDHRQVGRMAAEFMCRLGLKNFAVVGDSDTFWSNERYLTFRDIITQSSFPCEYFNLPFDRFNSDCSTKEASLHAWLQKLKKPVGIFSCYDMQAVQILNACHRLDISVPGDVSVLSVGNEDVVSEFCYPSLTTIALSPEKTGFIAAALLDRLLHGESLDENVTLIPPHSIILRESANRPPLNEPVAIEAMTLIQQHATKGLTVDQLSEMLCVSRSTLQRKYRQTYGITVHDSILDARLKKAKLLLSETDLSCSSIALQCGFDNESYFYTLFKMKTGMTCRQFRNSTKFHLPNISFDH